MPVTTRQCERPLVTRQRLGGPTSVDARTRLRYSLRPLASRPDDGAATRALCRPAVEAQGYELLELEWTREQGTFVLRVTIDHLIGAHDPAKVGPVKAGGVAEIGRGLGVVFSAPGRLAAPRLRA